jgi:hypothetical protein
MLEFAGNALQDWNVDKHIQKAVSTFFGIEPPTPGTTELPVAVEAISSTFLYLLLIISSSRLKHVLVLSYY